MIVAFTKDWDDVPTCTTHILREMAKTMPVLWVSSIGTRKPSAVSGKDIRRIAGRILCGLKPAEWKENKLRVLKPILIPKAEGRLSKWINRRIFAWYVRREMRQWLGVRSQKSGSGSQVGEGADLEYWCFVPNAVDLVPDSISEKNGESAKIVYYCADDWTQFHNLDGDWMDAKEQALVQRSDLVFVTSRFLENKLAHLISPLSTLHSSPSPVPRKLHYMPHAASLGGFFSHYIVGSCKTEVVICYDWREVC